jgi:ubiquinol-cytochrome c reductase iron-sulfur subunit
MNPSADVLALASIEVDVAQIQPGQAIKTIFRKQPLFIRNLTPAEIQAGQRRAGRGELRDPQTLAERTREGKPNWLITMGVCTHLGCVPLGAARARTRANMAAISAPATARTTTRPAASAKARRPPISKCRNMNSCPTPSSDRLR